MPQALLAQEPGRSGKGRKGSEGRRHVHLISEEDRGQDVMSGFRENATMVIAVDARHAMRQGVQFYRSRNGVVLTSDRIPPASILHYMRVLEITRNTIGVAIPCEKGFRWRSYSPGNPS